MFSNKISIFSKNSERINLIVPVFFVLFAFIQFGLKRNFYTENVPAMEFFLNYIFLNCALVIFTFIFSFFIPEFRLVKILTALALGLTFLNLFFYHVNPQMKKSNKTFFY